FEDAVVLSGCTPPTFDRPAPAPPGKPASSDFSGLAPAAGTGPAPRRYVMIDRGSSTELDEAFCSISDPAWNKFLLSPFARTTRAGGAAGGGPLVALSQRGAGQEPPTQLVALGGRARLLEQDGGDRLDPETRADLTRLAELARRVHDLVAALADVGRTC